MIIIKSLIVQKRMEGEFRRGVVHGRATYYLDNGTRYYKEPFKHEMKLSSFPDSLGCSEKGCHTGEPLL